MKILFKPHYFQREIKIKIYSKSALEYYEVLTTYGRLNKDLISRSEELKFNIESNFEFRVSYVKIV